MPTMEFTRTLFTFYFRTIFPNTQRSRDAGKCSRIMMTAAASLASFFYSSFCTYNTKRPSILRYFSKDARILSHLVFQLQRFRLSPSNFRFRSSMPDNGNIPEWLEDGARKFDRGEELRCSNDLTWRESLCIALNEESHFLACCSVRNIVSSFRKLSRSEWWKSVWNEDKYVEFCSHLQPLSSSPFPSPSVLWFWVDNCPAQPWIPKWALT